MFVPVLYSYTYNNKQTCTVFYEFMENKHEVLGFKAKLWGSRGETPSYIRLCIFQLK